MSNDAEECTFKTEKINHEDFGKCIRETWINKEGLIHRKGSPAVTLRYRKDEEPFFEEWCRNGMLHREGASARIDNFLGVETKEWFENGLAHRNDGSAVTIKFQNGIIGTEKWFKHGKEHRKDGASSITRDCDTGVVIYETWSVNGKLHREDGPASMETNGRGITIIEMWYLNGSLHRQCQDGPAYIRRDGHSDAIREIEFYENDVKLDVEFPSAMSAAPVLE